MNGLILSDNLEMVSVSKLTANKIKKLKVTELDEMLTDIPSGYQKAIVQLIRDLATNIDEDVKQEKYNSLGQMIEQVCWMKAQKQIQERVNDSVFLEDV